MSTPGLSTPPDRLSEFEVMPKMIRIGINIRQAASVLVKQHGEDAAILARLELACIQLFRISLANQRSAPHPGISPTR